MLTQGPAPVAPGSVRPSFWMRLSACYTVSGTASREALVCS